MPQSRERQNSDSLLEMKNFLASLAVVSFGIFAATAARADEGQVKITSVQFPEPKNRTAEVCGKVTNASLPAFVRLEVDYTMDKPAIYNVPVAADGEFCLVAVSLRGKIRGTVWHPVAAPAPTPVAPPSEN